MLRDQDEIKALVQKWQSATVAGDVDTVLGLMTDDVVFLVAGRPPMGKAEFEAALRVPPGAPRPKFEGTSEIQEIQVSGDMACMWTRLRVTVTPPDGGEPMTRAGHTLTVLRRVNGKWLLSRDANLLSSAPKEPQRRP